MTPEQFRDEVYPSIRSRWPFIRWDDSTMAACALDIGPVTPEIAVQVVSLMSREGVKNPPTGGQIYARAMQLLNNNDKPKPTQTPRSAPPPRTQEEPTKTSTWDARVDQLREAMRIVMDNEQRGIPTDPQAYPIHMRMDIGAAAHRRAYDKQMAAGLPIGNLVPPEVMAKALIAKAKAQGLAAVPKGWVYDAEVRAALVTIVRREKEGASNDTARDIDGAVRGDPGSHVPSGIDTGDGPSQDQAGRGRAVADESDSAWD